MTFLQILNIIKDTALAQPNVNTVVREFLDLNREDTVYSAVVIQDRDGLRDRIVEQDWNTYTWHLGYVDRLTYDESNSDDIISTGINVINSIVASIRDNFPDLEVSIIDRFSTFNQRFTAQCAGVYVVLAIQVPVSDCVDGESTDIYDSYTVSISENGVYHFVPDGRPVDEINITVDVKSAAPVIQELSVTENGTYNVPAGVDGYNPVRVALPLDDYATIDYVNQLMSDVVEYDVDNPLIEDFGLNVDVLKRPTLSSGQTKGLVLGYETYNEGNNIDTIEIRDGLLSRIHYRTDGSEIFETRDPYLTGQSLKTVNNQSLIGEGNIEISGLTPEQEEAVTPLIDTSAGVLYTRDLDAYTAYKYYFMSNNVSELKYSIIKLGDSVYSRVYSTLFKWNDVNFEFEEWGITTEYNTAPMWMDKSGRVYYGLDLEIDIPDEKTASISTTQVDLSQGSEARGYFFDYGYNKCNIFNGNDGIYIVSADRAFKFDEDNQVFDEIGFNNDPGIDVGYWLSQRYLVNYDGHFVIVQNQRMYEIVESSDSLDIIEVSDPYFPVTYSEGSMNIDSNNIYKIGSDYWYLAQYSYYILSDGVWTERSITDGTYYNKVGTGGAEMGDYLIGYDGYASDNYIVVTVGRDAYKVTDWTRLGAVGVDITSNQYILGEKYFRYIDVNDLRIKTISPKNGTTNISLGDNKTYASNISLSVDGIFTLNDKDVATINDCIVNTTVYNKGKRVRYIPSSGDPNYGIHYPISTDYRSVWTTPSGRVFNTNVWTGSIDAETYEFDGSSWNRMESGVFLGTTYHRRCLTTGGDMYMFFNNDSWLYRWDDTDSTWVRVVNDPRISTDEIWTVGDTIRSGQNYKLVNDEWVEDPLTNYYGPFSYLVGNNVYVVERNGHIYEYDESSKTFTDLGTYNDNGYENWFVFDGNLYYTYNNNVLKMIDFSKTGYLDVDTDIYINTAETTYFSCRYSDYLYTSNEYNWVSYCYDVEHTVPVVPSVDGAYVLKAVRVGNSVTYSWVEDEVPLAVQMTNQILG